MMIMKNVGGNIETGYHNFTCSTQTFLAMDHELHMFLQLRWAFFLFPQVSWTKITPLEEDKSVCFFSFL